MRIAGELADLGTFDVAIIGAGLAGTTAALRAQELGSRALLLDRDEHPAEAGNSRLSGGTIHAALLHMTEPPEVIAERILSITDGCARPELVEVFAANCGRAIDWLRSRNIEFEAREDWRLIILPRRPFDHVNNWRDVGPHRALVNLHEQFVAGGGTILGGATAYELVVDGHQGAVSGAIVRTDDGFGQVNASRVVLADGGFQANPEMLQRYVGRSSDRIKLRGSGAGKGDAIRMALPLRAQVVNMQYFYGHCLHRGALDDDRLWPMPMLDGVAEAGIVVDRSGRRVVDEGLGGIAIANAVARLDDPRGTWAIIDDATWAKEGTVERSAYQPQTNPDLEERGGIVHRADSISELAGLAGLDRVGLSETVEHYNAAVTNGRGGLGVPRTGEARPLSTPPFRAIPLVPGITFTMGGLAIDRDANVLDVDNQPIPGLFAAGGSAGGIQGGPRGGYVGGLSTALGFGLVAGESAARSAA